MQVGSGMGMASGIAMDVSMMMLTIKVDVVSVHVPTTTSPAHATPSYFLTYPTYYSLHMPKLVSWYQIDWKR